MDDQKDYKKYVSNKKNDYNRIESYLTLLENNGLDIPNLKYVKYIRSIIELMEDDDKKFIEKKPKLPKDGKA